MSKFKQIIVFSQSFLSKVSAWK